MQLVVLLEQFRRMADFSRPGQVRDVQQAIDALFDLDERAVVGHVPHGTGNNGSRRVLLFDEGPGVHLGLLHAKGNFLLVSVNFKDNNLNIVAYFKQF